MELKTTSRPTAIAAALLVTWLVWGSTFIAIHVALGALPPFLLMGSRFVVAGGLALAVGLWLTRAHGGPSRRQWRDAFLVGAGLVTIGMGATSWAVTRLPTGIAALLVASAPLWVVVLSSVTTRTRASGSALLGLAVGALGVTVLMLPSGGSSTPAIDVTAALVLLAANAAWAGASLFACRADTPNSLVLTTGMQMLAGGAMLMVLAAARGEFGSLSLQAVGGAEFGSWLYLVVAGSLAGFLAYGWLLERVTPSTAATHAFVNPVVAIALGAVLLAEPVGSRTLAASAAVLLAVVLLMRAEARGTQPTAATQSTPASARAARVPTLARHGARRGGWSPAPTPAFAARRAPRPWQATDGMDALAIDHALDAPLEGAE